MLHRKNVILWYTRSRYDVWYLRARSKTAKYMYREKTFSFFQSSFFYNRIAYAFLCGVCVCVCCMVWCASYKWLKIIYHPIRLSRCVPFWPTRVGSLFVWSWAHSYWYTNIWKSNYEFGILWTRELCDARSVQHCNTSCICGIYIII